MLQNRDFNAFEEEKFGLKAKIHDISSVPSGDRVGIILLHGRAGDETLMWVFSRAIENLDPIVIAPRALQIDPIGGFSWWGVVAQKEDEIESPSPKFTTLEDLKPGMEVIKNLALAMPNLYGVNANKIFVVGFSQGGGLAITLALQYPDLFKGVGLLASFIPSRVQQEYENKKYFNLNVFMSHGTKDEIIPIEKAQEAVRFLEKVGANLVFNSDEVGHKISSAGLRSFKEWLGQQGGKI